jgi:capsular exopolysaccharide synthesis family protein
MNNLPEGSSADVLLPVRVPSPEGADRAGPPAALTAKPNALAILKALKRRWLPALCIGLLCGGVVGGATWLVVPPAKSTAQALLHVSMVQQDLVYKNADRQPDFATYQRTQAALVKSRLVLNAALNRPEVRELTMIQEQTDPIQWLDKNLQTDYSKGPEFLRVSLRGDRPKELVILVNAVTKAYLEEIVNKEFNDRNARLDRLKTLFDQYDRQTRNKRQAFRVVAKEAGSRDSRNLALMQRIALERLAQSQKELTELQSEVRKLQVDLALQISKSRVGWENYAAVLGSLPRADLPVNLALACLLQNHERLLPPTEQAERPSPRDPLITEYLHKDPAAKKLLEQEAQLEAAVAEIKRVYRPNYFEKKSQKERKELKAVRKALDARRRDLVGVVAEQIRLRARLQAQGHLNQMRERLATLKRLETLLNEDVQRLDKQTRSINDSGLELESLRDDITQAEGTLKTITAELEKLKVERQAPPRVTSQEDAVIFHPEGNLLKIMATAGAGLGSLGLVLFGFGWWEFRSRKVDSLDEVVHGLGMRVVGTLPDMYRGAPSRLSGESDMPSGYRGTLFTESVDGVRTMLLHASRTESLRIVMVTSALPGEGKTSLASHLAASLDRAGRTTLLIDGDLRSPCLHRLFDLQRVPGFSELLRGESTLDEAIQQTSAGNLALLPAGRCSFETLQALAQDGPKTIFDQLRQRFDFIILDSSPVLPVADSLLMGQYADASLFSILHNVSRLPKVYAAYQRLAMLGIRMLGAVVNGTSGDVYDPGYQYLGQPDHK